MVLLTPRLCDPTMRSKSDFWLTLNQLTHDLEREGTTTAERATSVCEVLESLSAETRSVYLNNLEAAISALTEIRTRCPSS
jgi:hypothetical protein